MEPVRVAPGALGRSFRRLITENRVSMRPSKERCTMKRCLGLALLVFLLAAPADALREHHQQTLRLRANVFTNVPVDVQITRDEHKIVTKTVQYDGNPSSPS